jgi:hypothetical protein
VGAGGLGVRLFGDRGGPPQPRILTGNGAVFIGTNDIRATRERGEGVWLLRSARWNEYVLPPRFADPVARKHARLDPRLQGGGQSCSDFSITGPYAEWLALAVIGFRVPGRLNWDTTNLRFTNSAEANKYVKPVFRRGWEMKL